MLIRRLIGADVRSELYRADWGELVVYGEPE